MKDAYSNLLSSFHKAAELEYDDTTNLQMVCPCCREPVFKVRRNVDHDEVDYFSHYKAQIAIAAECERRVGAISDADKQSRNATAWNQSLALFRSVVQAALMMIPIQW